MDLSNYAINKEWELLEVSGRKNVIFYPCCPEPYPDLTFTLTLKRRNPAHYIYTLVVPSILLAMLIPVVFLLPAGSTEKTSLGKLLDLKGKYLQNLFKFGFHWNMYLREFREQREACGRDDKMAFPSDH